MTTLQPSETKSRLWNRKSLPDTKQVNQIYFFHLLSWSCIHINIWHECMQVQGLVIFWWIRTQNVTVFFKNTVYILLKAKQTTSLTVAFLFIWSEQKKPKKEAENITNSFKVWMQLSKKPQRLMRGIAFILKWSGSRSITSKTIW